MPASLRSQLDVPMVQVARRLRLRDGLTTLLATLCGGLAGALAGAVLVRFSGPLGAPLVPVLAGAVLAGGAVAVWLGLRRPRGAALAFRIDARTGQGEAYGTAWSLSQSDDAPGPVGGVLMRRVADRLGDFDSAAVQPVLTRATLWLVLAAALLLGGWLALRPPAVGPGLAGLPGASDRADDPRAALEDAVRRMAEDAEALENPYLQAVSRALDEALAASSEGELPRDEIETLLEHAARAYGEDLPDWLGAAPENRLAGLEQRLDDFAAAEAARDAAAAAREAAQAERGPSYFDRPADLDERYVGRDDDEVIGTQTGEGGEGDGTAEQMPPGGGAESEPRRMSADELQFAGRVPVGAALQSGKGESDQAGMGTQDFEEDTAFTELEAGAGANMIVSAEAQPGGNRIRIEVAPETAQERAQAGAAGALAGGGSRQIAPPDRSEVPMAQRGLVVRYLGRDAP